MASLVPSQNANLERRKKKANKKQEVTKGPNHMEIRKTSVPIVVENDVGRKQPKCTSYKSGYG